MAGKALKGCFGLAALGGLILLILAAILLWRVKDTALEIKHLKQSHDALVGRFGEVDEFTPASSGAVAGDRMERYLRTRRDVADERRRVEELFDEFPLEGVRSGENDGLGAAVRVFKGLGELLEPVLSYLRARNEALLTEQMGLGEYFYIYSVASFSYLGHSPGDGPVYEDGGKRERLLDGESSSFGREETRSRYHRTMQAIVARQLAAELSRPLEPGDGEALRWRERLRSEYLRFKDDEGAILWGNGLPERIEECLAPFKEVLARDYSPALNCFELGPFKDEELRLGED